MLKPLLMEDTPLGIAPWILLFGMDQTPFMGEAPPPPQVESSREPGPAPTG